MDTMSENVLYHDGNDVITPGRAVLGGKTFDLTTIKNVSLVAPVMRREYGYAAAALGIVLLVLGYFVWGAFLTPMLVGVVLIVVGIGVATVVRHNYIVHLNAADGKATAIPFPDRSRAERALAALSQALSGR